ncbi:MAG: hypothetical protein ACXVCY_11480 [Pseudobdellovibrionaceae bacterium]
MKWLYFSFIFLPAITAFGFDCSKIKPFKQLGAQEIHVEATRFFLSENSEKSEDLKPKTGKIRVFDVRGREEEAFWCLKPLDSEIITFDTMLDGKPAQIQVVPASWIRSFQKNVLREYRFHAYVVDAKDSYNYLDLFARSLKDSPDHSRTIIESAIKPSAQRNANGYFVRAEFLK